MEKLSVIGLSVVVTLGSGGCSWLFVQPLAPNYQSGDPVNCTSNVAAPVIDSIFTTLDTMELVSAAGNSNTQNRGAVVTGATLGIVLWGASAIYGYRHTSECSAAQSDDQPGPRPYRRRLPATTNLQPPPRPGLAPPVPAAPPAPAHEQADEPSVTAPSQPPAPQQRDDDGPG